MAKFHFNKETGRAGKCDAKIKCRLGLSESEHFATKEEAQKAYENTMNSKTVGSSLKKNTVGSSSSKFDVDTHTFSDKSGYYHELSGMTAQEIREHIINLNAEYDGREEGLKKDIADDLGINNITGFDTEEDWNVSTYINGDKFEVEEGFSGGGNFDPEADSYILEDRVEPEDYMTLELRDIEEYEKSTISIGGYYNDDNYVTSSFRIPQKFNNDVVGLQEFYKYSKFVKNAQNPNLPDWASIPQEMTMDGKHKTTKFAGRPNENTTRRNKLKKYADPQREIDRLNRAAKNLARKSDEETKKLQEINDYEKSSDKRNFVFTKNPDYRSQSQVDRRRTKEKIERYINSYNTQYVKNRDKRKEFENITSTQKTQAQNELNRLDDKYNKEVREYKIQSLANYYPHSKENIRVKNAEEWIDNHPDLTIDDF